MSARENTRTAVRHVLGGHPPNGISPESCGRYADKIQGLYEAHATGQTAGARRYWSHVCQMDRELARLTSTDDPSGIVLLSNVEREPVEWIWQNRLARGKTTGLDGDPGIGKSTMYCEIAARITTGRDWPDGYPCKRGGVLIITTEDDPADTILPRMEEAGADVSRVAVMNFLTDEEGRKHPVMIPDNLSEIERGCEMVGADLIVIDPIMPHLGCADSHRDQDVRGALAPLGDMAKRVGCAVLWIRHLNKQYGGKAIYRGSGSIAFSAAARITLFIGEHPEEDDQYVMACSKINLGPYPESLAYSIQPSPHDPAIPIIQWEGVVPLTANDLVAQKGERESPALNQAIEWLESQLAAGPKPAAWLYDAAQEAGISERTLKRAKRRVADSDRTGGLGRAGYWYWFLKGTDVSDDDLHVDDSTKGAKPGGNVGGSDQLSVPGLTEMAPLGKSSQKQRFQGGAVGPLSSESKDTSSLRGPSSGDLDPLGDEAPF